MEQARIATLGIEVLVYTFIYLGAEYWWMSNANHQPLPPERHWNPIKQRAWWALYSVSCCWQNALYWIIWNAQCVTNKFTWDLEKKLVLFRLPSFIWFWKPKMGSRWPSALLTQWFIITRVLIILCHVFGITKPSFICRSPNMKYHFN